MTATTRLDTRWITLVVLCAGMLMIVLDNTVVNVALPSIQADLGFTQASLAWVINAYMIAFGGLLLLAGRLGDLIGSKRIFLCGLLLFTVASLACGLAWTGPLLVAARFVQGIGGALASAVILAMLFTMFTDPEERARAMGVFSFTAAAGGSIGLLLGGIVTQLVNWHWVFLINVPIGIATAIAGFRLIPAQRGIGIREGADALGAVLVTAALMLAVYTVVEIPQNGLMSTRTLVLGITSVVLLAAFVVRQATARKPLLHLRIFTSRNVIGSNVLQLVLVAGMFGFFFLDSLYLRGVLGYDAVATGFAFLPVTIAIGALSVGWSAKLATRFGPRPVVTAGCALAAVGLAIFAVAPLESSYATTLLPAMLLIGVGMGASFPSLMVFAMSGIAPEDAGLASGLINTTAEVGGAFGLAILATLSAARTSVLLAAGTSQAAAQTGGYHLAFGVAAGCLAISALVAATVLDSADVSGAQAEEQAA